MSTPARAGFIDGTDRKVFTLELNQPAAVSTASRCSTISTTIRSRRADNVENIIGINLNDLVVVTDTGDPATTSRSPTSRINVIDDVPLAVLNTATLNIVIDELEVNTIVAEWTNIAPGAGISTFDRDGDTKVDEMRWGGTGNPLTDSGYGFVDAPAANIDDLVTNDTFSLGTFTHYNFPVSGTTLSSATLNVRFNVVIDGVPVNNVGPILVNFTHTETPNDGNNNPNDGVDSRDIISITTTTATVNIAGQNYVLEVLGFVDGGGNVVSTVRTDESAANNFQLAARFSLATDLTIGGNVLTNDSAGADGAAAVIGIAFGANSDTNPAGDFQVNGQYGTLVVQANGVYVYTLTADGASVPPGAVETFVYTMRDGDGDTATANLALTLNVVDNVPPTVAVNIVDTALNDGDPSSVVTFEFSENVTGFESTDLTAVDGTLELHDG